MPTTLTITDDTTDEKREQLMKRLHDETTPDTVRLERSPSGYAWNLYAAQFEGERLTGYGVFLSGSFNTLKSHLKRSGYALQAVIRDRTWDSVGNTYIYRKP